MYFLRNPTSTLSALFFSSLTISSGKDFQSQAAQAHVTLVLQLAPWDLLLTHNLPIAVSLCTISSKQVFNADLSEQVSASDHDPEKGKFGSRNRNQHESMLSASGQ